MGIFRGDEFKKICYKSIEGKQWDGKIMCRMIGNVKKLDYNYQ